MTEEEKVRKVKRLPRIKKRVQLLALLSYCSGGLLSTQISDGYGIIFFVFVVIFTNLSAFIYWRITDVCPWCNAAFTMNVTKPIRIFHKSPSKILKENELVFNGSKCINCGAPHDI